MVTILLVTLMVICLFLALLLYSVSRKYQRQKNKYQAQLAKFQQFIGVNGYFDTQNDVFLDANHERIKELEHCFVFFEMIPSAFMPRSIPCKIAEFTSLFGKVYYRLEPIKDVTYEFLVVYSQMGMVHLKNDELNYITLRNNCKYRICDVVRIRFTEKPQKDNPSAMRTEIIVENKEST